MYFCGFTPPLRHRLVRNTQKSAIFGRRLPILFLRVDFLYLLDSKFPEILPTEMEKRKNKSEVLKNDIIDVLVESLHIAYVQRRIRQYMCNKQSVRIGTKKESLPVSVFQLEKKMQKEKCLLRSLH